MKKCAKFAYQRLTSDMPADQTPACHPRSHRWSSASVELVSAGDRKWARPLSQAVKISGVLPLVQRVWSTTYRDWSAGVPRLFRLCRAGVSRSERRSIT